MPWVGKRRERLFCVGPGRRALGLEEEDGGAERGKEETRAEMGERPREERIAGL